MSWRTSSPTLKIHACDTPSGTGSATFLREALVGRLDLATLPDLPDLEETRFFSNLGWEEVSGIARLPDAVRSIPEPVEGIPALRDFWEVDLSFREALRAVEGEAVVVERSRLSGVEGSRDV